MTTTPDFRAELEKLVDLYEALGGNWSPHGYTDTWNDAVASARAALATPPPEPPTVMEALAARPLLEQVARLGDCIGANTVGKIMAISSRAAAWLEANPPGQPVAIEPRGCPTPGACSCVEPATPSLLRIQVTKTELRALATELLATLDRYQHLLDKTWHPDHPDAVEREKELTAGSYLLDRARAELAVPEAEPPTDEELVTFLYVIDPEEELSPLAMVRAALERWGHG